MSSNEELEEMIRHLQTRLVYLEGRVAILESARNNYINYVPAKTDPFAHPICSKCGMSLKTVMNYTCVYVDCPSFPQVTC